MTIIRKPPMGARHALPKIADADDKTKGYMTIVMRCSWRASL